MICDGCICRAFHNARQPPRATYSTMLPFRFRGIGSCYAVPDSDGKSWLSEDDIADQLLMTTHNLPLTFLLETSKEIAPEMRFLGIQPHVIAFAYPASPSIREAVALIHQQLLAGRLNFPEL